MKKKLLFLINTLRDGGAEKILVNIVNNLNPNEYEIEVRLIYKRGVYLDKLNNNIRLTYISGSPGTFKSKWLSRLLPRLSSEVLHKLFIKGKYDTEVAFLEGYATKIVAGAPKGTRKVAWVHCDVTKTEWITGVFKNEQGFINCYKKIDEVVSVSESVKNAFINRFGDVKNHSVKYNPVDDRDIKEKSMEKLKVNKDIKKNTLVSVGRFTYPKNFMRLLNAVNNLVKNGYEIELWLLGDGEDRKKLDEYIKSRDLENVVYMPGFVSNPYPFIKAADLYVCSSIYEGFSTTATEALILGTPVLTTDVSGMSEMLEDGMYGLIVPNDDCEFEKGLQFLLDDPYMLKYYRKKAEERSTYFELKNRLKAIEDIL